MKAKVKKVIIWRTRQEEKQLVDRDVKYIKSHITLIPAVSVIQSQKVSQCPCASTIDACHCAQSLSEV